VNIHKTLVLKSNITQSEVDTWLKKTCPHDVTLFHIYLFFCIKLCEYFFSLHTLLFIIVV